jgi:hypothetical protein
MKNELRNLTHVRATTPAAFRDALINRKRRSEITSDGKLFLIAADHTARGAISVGKDQYAMANRADLLSRLLTALPHCDGILASADILEDLAYLGSLDKKVVIGTTNRGGIVGAEWELDDRMTAYDAAHIEESGLDGAKALLRIALDDAASAKTIEDCARLVTELNDRKLMAMIEPLPYHLTTDDSGRKRAKLLKDESQLIAATTIASGLGASSAYTWLKLPAWSNVSLMAQATTLPILLLGGEVTTTLEESLNLWSQSLHIAERPLQGLVIGRGLLYPQMESGTSTLADVEYAVKRAAAITRP